MSYIGTTEIGKMFLGTTEISKAYLGSTLVFQEDSSPTPVITPVFYDNLIFDGTAYIDTNVIPPTDPSFKVYLGSEAQKISQRLFMVNTQNSSYIGPLLNSSTSTTTRQFSVYYGKSSSVSSNRTLKFSTTVYNFFLTPKRFGWGTTSYTFTKGSNTTPSGGIVLGSNTNHAANQYTGIMRTFYIYSDDAQNATKIADFDSYTPVATLRPCTYNGVAGMWHVEGNTFYGNTAGSGSLSVSNNS